ncbi:MAG: lyase family protein [Ilumatobacteraceae bacterium]
MTTLYPGFSTERMDEIFSLSSRVSAMAAVEAAVAAAQGAADDIPTDAAAAIVAACAEPIDVAILAAGWQVGTPVLGLLDALRARLPGNAVPFLHRSLTTQDVVDTAAMLLARDAMHHLDELARSAAESMRGIIRQFGSVATQARSFLQSADVTTVGFRTARWVSQLDQVRGRRTVTPVQIGGLIGDRMGISDEISHAAARQLGLDDRLPWHTNRAPIIEVTTHVNDFARWADKVGGDIAQLVQLGEITTRAGGSSAAVGKRNPIDSMRAMAAAEACLGVSTIITHAKPHELERGLGSWHAEWFALPLVFQTAGAAMEAIATAIASLEVEPSALVVADDRRAAADSYVTSILEQSP